MNCHMCGQREASIHLLEMINGQQESVWLCSVCATDRTDLQPGDLAETVFGKAGQMQGEQASLASFLGQSDDIDQVPGPVADCPECGYGMAQFQESNRLGCALCYQHFQPQLRPILARYHRHVSHLGKIPHRAGSTATHQGELTRLRVDLEKAIQGEDYEEAARLRDMLRQLVAEQKRSERPDNGEGEPS